MLGEIGVLGLKEEVASSWLVDKTVLGKGQLAVGETVASAWLLELAGD